MNSIDPAPTCVCGTVFVCVCVRCVCVYVYVVLCVCVCVYGVCMYSHTEVTGWTTSRQGFLVTPTAIMASSVYALA